MARRTRIRLVTASLTLGALLALAACVHPVDNTGPPNPQGWTPGNQAFWYETSQGSRLIPKTWYDALERADSTEPFSDQQFLATFGYLPSAPDRLSERHENLPIGFAVDRQADAGLVVTGLHWYKGQASDKKNAEPWVGLNCAACHSGEMTYKGDRFRVDGAPTIADFQSFIAAFDAALTQTLTDSGKFDRFAAKVLAGKDDVANRALLKAKVAEMVAWEDRVAQINGDRSDRVARYGYARLDAVGHIYNKVALFNHADPQPGNPSDAPVSYPFLWDITKQHQVQWNGSAVNQRLTLNKGELDYGAMGRNTGEVIGVFGEIITAKRGQPGNNGKLPGFKSTVQIEALDQLENVLTTLKSPIWPVQFGAINQALKAQGEVVFDRLKCGSCHIEREDWKPNVPIEKMITLRELAENNQANLTDIWMACNGATYFAKTGNLEGGLEGIIKGRPLEATEPMLGQLAFSVKLSLADKRKDIIKRAVQIYLGIQKLPVIDGAEEGLTADEARAARAQLCITGKDGNGAELPADTLKLLAYKARPLDGIWATSPYLHNGSVPTLYHLLLAPKNRPTRFYSGSREFDPKFVGYVWKDKPTGPHSQFTTVDGRGKAIPGNSTAGHDYGVGGLTEADRLALLEYLKSL